MCFLRTLPHFLIIPIPLCCCCPLPYVIDLCHVNTCTLLHTVSSYLPHENEGSGLVWFIVVSLARETVPACLLSECRAGSICGLPGCLYLPRVRGAVCAVCAVVIRWVLMDRFMTSAFPLQLEGWYLPTPVPPWHTIHIQIALVRRKISPPNSSPCPPFVCDLGPNPSSSPLSCTLFWCGYIPVSYTYLHLTSRSF